MTRSARAHRTRSTFRAGRGSHPYLGVLAFRGTLAKESRRLRELEKLTLTKRAIAAAAKAIAR